MLLRAPLTVIAVATLCLNVAYGASDDVCTDNVLQGTYKYEPRCTAVHVSDALRVGEGCAPRPTLVNLPWPNSTQIDQVH